MQNNDENKIAELYSLYEQSMFVEARKILQDDYLAEDAVHEAFIRLIRNRSSLRDVESPQTKRYVKRTVQSAAIDIYRKNKREREHICNFDEADPVFSYSDELEYSADLIDSLPQKYASIIRCRLIYGLSVNETAAVLELTANCVKKRYERARKMLAEILRETL